MSGFRVAMVVFSYYPLDVRVRREVEALSEAGSAVEVIALRGDGEPRQERLNGVNVYRINIKQKRVMASGEWPVSCATSSMPFPSAITL